jgi:hypothetical protein
MGATEMAIYTKITRRVFNKISTIAAFFGFSVAKTKLEAQDPYHDPELESICDKMDQEDRATDYMEVLIIPEDFRYPYSHKVRKVLYNHKMAGKSREEIKQFILSHSKVIKVPIK